VQSRSSRRLSADESRLVEAWAQFGDPAELKRICNDILARPRQGYAVAFGAKHIIAAHSEYWRLDAPIEADGSRRNQALLKAGPGVGRRLDQALHNMIDLHRGAEERPWYGKKIVDGEIQQRRDGSATAPARPWSHYRRLYERTLRALASDPLWLTLRQTPRHMWLIPPRGNPAHRRNGALMNALRSIGLTRLQVDDVIHALGWTLR
jgi:hypothetical protein